MSERDNLKEIIEIFVDKWDSTNELWSKNFLNGLDTSYKGYKLRISYGQGRRLTKNPWISFLKDENKVNDGIYPYIEYHNNNDKLLASIGKSNDNIPNYEEDILNKIDKYSYLKFKKTDIDSLIKQIDINITEFEKIISPIILIKDNYNMNTKNIILYGPPGVGKTHNYQNIISMIENGKQEKEIFDTITKNEKISLNDEIFKKIKDENRVKFITFHQNYSYEDFIEGFRPTKEGNIKLEDGIFKEIVDKAIENSISIKNEITEKMSDNPTIYKISLGERGNMKSNCFNEDEIRVEWNNYGNLDETNKLIQRDLNTFYDHLKIGDIVLAFKNKWEIDGIGIIVDGYKFKANYENYRHTRPVKWILKNKTINIKTYNKNIQLTLLTIYKLTRIKKNDILEMISQNINDSVIKQERKNFYLIIDEINRGNISKIFGELITLIEEDKRDDYEITLPYSKENFKIPSNLYIIGTMNSTDKSIATIDIALRRRFTFLKMLPNLELVENEEARELMKKLNTYIESKLGEDYMLGHSYFMKVKTDDDLEFVKQYKIKPLLEEYFYADDKTPDDIINEALGQNNEQD